LFVRRDDLERPAILTAFAAAIRGASAGPARRQGDKLKQIHT